MDVAIHQRFVISRLKIRGNEPRAISDGGKICVYIFPRTINIILSNNVQLYHATPRARIHYVIEIIFPSTGRFSSKF